MAEDSSTDVAVLVLNQGATGSDIDHVMATADALHFRTSMARGDGWIAVAIGDGVRPVPLGPLAGLSAVDAIVPVRAPYRLASREVFDRDTPVHIELRSDAYRSPGFDVGGGAPIAIVARCQDVVGDETGFGVTMGVVQEAGASLVHLGRFPPNSTVSASGGGPRWAGLRGLAHDVGLGVCVEVADPRFVDEASSIADVLEVGSRSMQDFNLLRALGENDRPVIVKRGFGATVEEFLLAAEYVLMHGNGRVIICESGIRTFDVTGRPRFEINAIPVIKRATHLPLLADPSQSSSDLNWVPAVARAAVAAGADGLMLDLKPRDGSTSESPSGIDASTIKMMMGDLEPIADAVGRQVSWRVMTRDA